MMSPLYSPLDTSKHQIRLLHLAPAASEEDKIVCQLSLASLDENIEYEALSYVWGDVKDTVPIKLSWISSEKSLSSAYKRFRSKIRARVLPAKHHLVPVTKNLFSALKHVRLRNKVRILWVDALCINQSDLGERSHQVPYMNAIFGGASSVVVWLGEVCEGSNLAMDVVQQLGENEEFHLDRSLSPSLVINGVGLESEDLCHHLIRFFDLPWWKRVWTIQEFVLAKHVILQCGQRLLPGELLFNFRRALLEHVRTCCVSKISPFNQVKTAGMNVFQAIDIVHSLEAARAHREESNFLYILAQFRNCQTSDSRDRVYGMLSLAFNFSMKPDYTLSGAQVFENFAVATINQTRTLDIFSHLFGQRILKLPSFVPDFTGSVSDLPRHLDRLFYLELTTASGDSLAVFNLISPGIAVTRGVIVDKIVVVGQRDVEGMQKLAEIGHEDGTPYKFTGEPIRTAIAQTFCGGLGLSSQSNDTLSRIVKPFDLAVFEKWQAWLTALPPVKASLFDYNVAVFNSAFLMASRGRHFIKTRNGLVGFGPDHSREGDLIAVLAGGRVPYVLRREHGINHEGHPCYSVLGDSYIHGIMDGEVFEQLDESVLEDNRWENSLRSDYGSDYSSGQEIQDGSSYKLTNLIIV